MHNLVILQARMSSTRLPSKVLLEVMGKPLLAYECERILTARNVDELIIATSVDPSDDPIEVFAISNNLAFFRGDLNDVLSRYYHCATQYRNRHTLGELNIIRLTGDCPLIDPEIIDKLIGSFNENDCQYCSNTLTPTYPDGMDVEVFCYESLKKAYECARYPSDREHVTLYMKNNSSFKKFNVIARDDDSRFRLTVDESKDFLLVKKILEEFYPKNSTFTYKEVVSFLMKNKDINNINSGISRDEGLVRSLIEDGRV
jgi:spore coat polysaccharide biosynthesis protein SpsF